MSRGPKPQRQRGVESYRRPEGAGRLHRCPVCGETLSGPAKFYQCPQAQKRAEAA